MPGKTFWVGNIFHFSLLKKKDFRVSLLLNNVTEGYNQQIYQIKITIFNTNGLGEPISNTKFQIEKRQRLGSKWFETLNPNHKLEKPLLTQLQTQREKKNGKIT